MTSLRAFTAGAITLAVLTVLILPLPLGTRLFLLAVGVFCAVFIAVDAGGRGKAFAALVTVALSLYLVLTAQRGFIFLQNAGALGALLGGALIVLPVLGAWAMIREIIFGSRTQALGQELAAAGELPEDTLPRTEAGRIDRAAADSQFTHYATATEKDPTSWKNWFHLSLAYDASGDRKRARKAMRTAIALRRGKNPTQVTI
ncbi:hypothetical protein [Rothia nasimurium]|uniref:hypothetical protein n=1 Tax=Rothia nasimurium TaxID=85336 RepID=UPI001F2AD547|nr:hypothetical protein [Rothia nasimurium]